MKKMLTILFVFVISLSILGCSSDTSKEISSSSATTSSTPEKSLSDEQDIKEFLAKQNKKLEAVEPQRKEMEQALTTTLSGYKLSLEKNISVSDSENLVFSVMPEIIIDGVDKEQATQEAVQIIQKLSNSNMPYTVDMYSISISNSKHNPLALVQYIPETGKYISFENGKATEIQP